ncbi:hypothetical protein [Bradyrhizobium sp. RP6]|uniref:hypothetical protein n=1 Tax=Bradyrhizobium sp. RP6 TaxID=2489596 RepID=UPI000F546CB9|nr:hypothetical protein [Bradyrhizobium sp. RP6]RQH06877.1 hypothetical protein EHH60_30190 [Bradyrhizobium sp. RP6]
MSKVLIFAQEKGGCGRSTNTRAAAEAVPAAPVIELEINRRLTELGDRAQHFPIRASREEIERTGGRAARSEFDAFIEAMVVAEVPAIVDLGANTSTALLSTISEVANDLRQVGVEFGIVIIATAEPGALASVPLLDEIVSPWASARFLVENQLHGPINPIHLDRIANGAVLTSLPHHLMDTEAEAIFQAGGFACICDLDSKALAKKYGLMRGLRIQRDLARFRLAAMRAVEPAARWLVAP